MELNSSTVVEYEYDSKSRLLQRVEGGTTTNYTWNGWSLIKEVKTGAISETTDYLLPANAFERGGDWFYMHTDGLSSTQLVTDENGDQVARFIYGAWGEELYASESVPGVLENRFVGGLGCRKDVATGLIYMRHRWYDPALQRFISRDPIGLEGGANLYKYAGNNPTRFTDPMGLLETDSKGNVIVQNDPSGKIYDTVYYGQGWGVKLGTIKTDDGTPLQVLRNIDRDTNPGATRNCHGFTFGVPHWLDDTQIEKLIKGDGYFPVSPFDIQPDDVVIYRKDGLVNHSARVKDVSPDPATFGLTSKVNVIGEGGLMIEPTVGPIETASPIPGSTPTIYRKL